MVRLQVEIFFVTFPSEDHAHYLRRCFALDGEGKDPDAVLKEAIAEAGTAGWLNGDARPIAHSTSWRWDAEGGVVLTYLVYADRLHFAPQQARRLPLAEMRLAPGGGADSPRPPCIEESHVVSHGLRHLGFLLRRDRQGVYTSRVDREARRLFATLTESLAGRAG
jgi:hypothetical protein